LKIKLDNPTGLNSLIEYYDQIDSNNFCGQVFGLVKSAAEEKVTITKNAELKLKLIRQ
jgi:hypothetical protein